jgi:hypothetical protein
MEKFKEKCVENEDLTSKKSRWKKVLKNK